jgi:hypothetical protein
VISTELNERFHEFENALIIVNDKYMHRVFLFSLLPSVILASGFFQELRIFCVSPGKMLKRHLRYSAVDLEARFCSLSSGKCPTSADFNRLKLALGSIRA